MTQIVLHALTFVQCSRARHMLLVGDQAHLVHEASPKVTQEMLPGEFEDL